MTVHNSAVSTPQTAPERSGGDGTPSAPGLAVALPIVVLTTTAEARIGGLLRMLPAALAAWRALKRHRARRQGRPPR
ncbi:hypothetical protein GCM10027160_39930 [Streptomyces calidiresistens]|uniref:Uncharacterized protein n=1 Tax=Streptomyces calidiresistens TaxID=1485586 RepID=A0A7W3T1L9_9ACTN|nr:hypothetical protein [Streptomyces calidiresistens]MBB0229240.1 hypothetical protein [Streptomyces calidiresistens]